MASMASMKACVGNRGKHCTPESGPAPHYMWAVLRCAMRLLGLCKPAQLSKAMLKGPTQTATNTGLLATCCAPHTRRARTQRAERDRTTRQPAAVHHATAWSLPAGSRYKRDVDTPTQRPQDGPLCLANTQQCPAAERLQTPGRHLPCCRQPRHPRQHQSPSHSQPVAAWGWASPPPCTLHSSSPAGAERPGWWARQTARPCSPTACCRHRRQTDSVRQYSRVHCC
jgi:hypothetical protein